MRKSKIENLDSEIEDLAAQPEQESEIIRIKKQLLSENLIGCGSTMVNLNCTNTPYGCFLKGRYYLIVGASGAGKTWISMSIFGEAKIHPFFKNHKLIFDNKEEGADMDWGFYFGDSAANCIKAPCPDRIGYYDKDGEVSFVDGKGKTAFAADYSVDIEDFYDNMDNQLNEAERTGTGFIYVLDSMDSLSSKKLFEEIEEAKKARVKGDEVKGSYGDGKAKINSQRLKMITSRLSRTGSILVIICQERDNLGYGGGKTFTGGNALPFYACGQFWLKSKSDITAVINKKERPLGTLTHCDIRKNRMTGLRSRKLEISFYHSFGIDDIGDMIQFLLDEGHWEGGKQEKSAIIAPEFESEELNKEGLARFIDCGHLKDQLVDIVWKVWNDLQETIESKVSRRRRYE